MTLATRWLAVMAAVAGTAFAFTASGAPEAQDLSYPLLEALRGQDTVWVMRFAPNTDPDSAARRPFRALPPVRADSTWSRRLFDVLSDLPYVENGRCRERPEGDRPPILLRARLSAKGSVYQLDFDFSARCAQVSRPGRVLGALRFASGDSALLELFRVALPKDSALQRAELPASHEADSRHAPSEDPKLREYIFVQNVPEAIHKVPPEYPDGARKLGVDGTVQVKALVAVDGRVEKVVIVHSIPELDAAATQAVRQWLFKPARAGGTPVAVWVAIPVRFSLH